MAMDCDITKLISINQASLDIIYISTAIHGFPKQQLHVFLCESEQLLNPNGILTIVEIEKKETPFGPPLNIRFSMQELMEIVPMAPMCSIQAEEYFYMQLFRNTKQYNL
ncbi:MAG: hypothetical protein AB9873_21010 [Syntrophobacteraceae bacterium]